MAADRLPQLGRVGGFFRWQNASIALLSLTPSLGFAEPVFARHSSSKLGFALAYSQSSSSSKAMFQIVQQYFTKGDGMLLMASMAVT